MFLLEIFYAVGAVFLALLVLKITQYLALRYLKFKAHDRLSRILMALPSFMIVWILLSILLT